MQISFPRRAPRLPASPRRGPQSRLGKPLPQVGASLRFTEILVLAGLGIACFLSISTPIFGVQLHLSALNHMPLVWLAPALVLHLTGMLLSHHRPAWENVFKACYPLITLGLFALVGSAFAKWAFEERDTYLTFGVYLLLLPLFCASVPTQAERGRRWAIVLLSIWILAAVVSLTGTVARFGSKETLHEIEYLVATGFLAMFYAARSSGIKFVALLMMIAAAALNQKLTGFIITAGALMHIAVIGGWRRLVPSWRGVYSIGATTLSAAVIAALVLLYFEFQRYLPSGNVDVRLAQYGAAMRQFIDSPIWGNAYLQNSGESYRESFRLLNIPTHSDVLDILKHGGLIGFGLFAWGYWKLFSILNRALRVTEGERLWRAYFLAARFFLVTALVTFSLNPLLLKGPFLVVIWGNLGLAAGLGLAVLSRARRGAA